MSKIDINEIIDEALRTVPDINNTEAACPHKRIIGPIYKDPIVYRIKIYDF